MAGWEPMPVRLACDCIDRVDLGWCCAKEGFGILPAEYQGWYIVALIVIPAIITGFYVGLCVANAIRGVFRCRTS